MGATLSSPSRADLAELDELRRLAYGPGPGIGHDLAAQARLVELESAVRRASAPPLIDAAPLAAERPSQVQGTPVQKDPPSAPIGSVDDAGPVEASAAEAPTAGGGAAVVIAVHRPARHRRAGLAACVLAVLAAVVAASTLTGASLDVTLQPRADVPADASAELIAAEELDYLGISPADVRLYEEFRGLNIWSGPRGTSSTCMFVTTDARPRWRVDCAPWSGEPTIDLIKYRESSRLSGIEAWGDMPVGSMIRLVLRDGAVVAQTVDAPGSAGWTR